MKKKKLHRRYGHMAYNRAVFKAKLRQHLTGALGEFYKATAVKKNGQRKYVQHWTTEVNRLLREMGDEFAHTIRGGYDLHRAYEEVKVEIRESDANFRKRAESSLRKKYSFGGLTVKLDDADEAEFWRQADLEASV